MYVSRETLSDFRTDGRTERTKVNLNRSFARSVYESSRVER